MRMLHGLADLNKSLSLSRWRVCSVAVVGDFDPAHQFHDEKRPAGFRRSRIDTLAMFGWSINARACRSASNGR